MIKRRFYRLEHGDKDTPSESSSDSEVEVQTTDETEFQEEEDEEENAVLDERHKGETSSSSGYESEDSSANEVNLDSSGLPTSDDDDVVAQNGDQNSVGTFAISEGNNLCDRLQHSPEKDESPFDVKDCVIKCKSVFKCRLCPRIVCLSEETLKAHLNSKRHARSEKLYREGRLKLMLNSEGQLEGESHPGNRDTTTVSGQNPTKMKKKGKGQWKQRKRSKQETRFGKTRQSIEKRGKRQKNE